MRFAVFCTAVRICLISNRLRRGGKEGWRGMADGWYAGRIFC